MRKNRYWIYVLLIIVALAAAGFLMFGRSGNRVTYRTATAERGDISVNITATGTLSADTTVQVGSQVSGRIARLYADFNSQVKSGQLLAELDPTLLQAQVSEAVAALDKARSALDDSERSYKRISDLFKKNLVAQADMDAATAALEGARASYNQAKASLDMANVNLRYTIIRAPISGVVISRNVDVGQTVAASLQAPTLFTIANDLKKMQVQASIDEADIGNVQIGQEVTFRVDAFPDRVFHGSVSQVRLAPVVTQNVVMYTVIVDVQNRDLKLMPGMTANVSIGVAEKDSVLRVPIQAVQFTPPGAEMASASGAPSSSGGAPAHPRNGGPQGSATGGRRPGNWARIWVLRAGKPVPVSIDQGLQNEQYVEVKDGDLNEGDQVIVGAIGGTQTTSAAQNPFGPQRFGGGRGGR